MEHLQKEILLIHEYFEFRRPKDFSSNSLYHQAVTYFGQFGINIHHEIFAKGKHGKIKNFQIGKNRIWNIQRESADDLCDKIIPDFVAKITVLLLHLYLYLFFYCLIASL